MNKQRPLALALALVFAFSFIGAAAETAEQGESTVYYTRSREPLIEIGFDTQAKSAALIEAETGMPIAAQNCGERLPMASTTKIMTALIIAENCRLDETVTVDDAAVGVEGSSIYLVKGERITVEDLLYGLMLASGNDAAVALACHAAGSAAAFADMMNARAAELGLTQTHFVTPNGLSAEGHYTTAYELCLIAREALKNPIVKRIVSSKYYTTSSGDHTRTFKNKNALLWDYEGAIGVKTGYTAAAGRCLVFAAERDGMTLIGALLNCRPMFETASRLLDIAYENCTLCTVVAAGAPVGSVEIKNCVDPLLSVEAKDSIIIPMRKGGAESAEVRLQADELTAPIACGRVVGTLTVYVGGLPYAACPLAASRDAARRDTLFWLKLLIASFFQ